MPLAQDIRFYEGDITADRVSDNMATSYALYCSSPGCEHFAGFGPQYFVGAVSFGLRTFISYNERISPDVSRTFRAAHDANAWRRTPR